MEEDAPDARPAASKPVMIRIPLEMWEDVDSIARRELSTVASVMRRLAKERLDQLRKDERERGEGTRQ